MNIQQVIDAISTVGFPIVLAVFMVALLLKQSAYHKDEVKALTETINSNTQVLKELKTVIQSLVK